MDFGTSSKGYRHFEVIQFGGRGAERWVELFPVLKKEIRLKVDWSELKNHKEWASGWLHLPESKDGHVEIDWTKEY